MSVICLIAKDPDGASQRDLIWTEPNSGYIWRDSQNENLRHRRHCLADENHVKSVRSDTHDVDPSSQCRPDGTQYDGEPQALGISLAKRL